jgi:hypothetical protein
MYRPAASPGIFYCRQNILDHSREQFWAWWCTEGIAAKCSLYKRASYSTGTQLYKLRAVMHL